MSVDFIIGMLLSIIIASWPIMIVTACWLFSEGDNEI